MTKIAALLVAVFCIISVQKFISAFPETRDVNPATVVAEKEELNDAADADELKTADTIGLGYYPGFYGGGVGPFFGGYRPSSLGYGYHRRWGYGGGWSNYNGFYHPPIYPAWG